MPKFKVLSHISVIKKCVWACQHTAKGFCTLVSVFMFAQHDHPEFILFLWCISALCMLLECIESVCICVCLPGVVEPAQCAVMGCGRVRGAPALAISMSFHGAPQWLLGDSITGMGLSLLHKMTTPCGTTRSVRHL